ncbi:MAG: VanW family protein [Chloroflexi bacterium]|nr:VanW family protein [Chloroflexota bacterium]
MDMNDRLEPAADPPAADAPADATAPDPDPAEPAELGAPPESIPAPAHRRHFRLGRPTFRRFAAAFTFGVLGVLAVSAGALAAFESSNNGRILPGVHVGSVDLSGLTPSEARAALNDAYATLGEGELVLAADGTTWKVSYASIGRRLDVDAIVDEAMALGRSGETLERIASNIRNMVRGVQVAPEATFELAALRLEIQELAAAVDAAPVDATVTLAGEAFVVAPGEAGRSTDIDAVLAAAAALLIDPASPASAQLAVPLDVVEPAVTTAEADAARDAATSIAVDVKLVDRTDSWTIPGASIRGWITFAATPDGGFGPVVAEDGLEVGLTEIADDVARAPVDASFLIGNGASVVGVTEAQAGRAIDIPGTMTTLAEVIQQRAHGLTVSQVPVSTSVIEPDLTTAEATETAPLMRKISEWTTYFPIGIKNGQGANIWIPARDIDGYVLLPGKWFDFWEAIGPVTRERGYKDGGAIINGKTEPQGALAGGICSCSTTLFNAALRAGLEMGARRNHYYYIDRYPLGLDATVFQSSSGSVQTMSFKNDTANPILIRGIGWNVGSKGYVKFELWSVPTGRDVDFTTPIVKNVKPASDSTQYVTSLPPGVRERIEYPVDGKDVWVTRIVKDAAGNVIHQETYYSHYARITGILQIGKAAEPEPTPTPEPTPSPTT